MGPCWVYGIEWVCNAFQVRGPYKGPMVSIVQSLGCRLAIAPTPRNAIEHY